MKRKRVCMIVNWSTFHDSRVLRSAIALSGFCDVDLYHVPVNETEAQTPASLTGIVNYISLKQKNNWQKKLFDHSYTHLSGVYLAEQILKRDIKYDVVYTHDLLAAKAGEIIAEKNKSIWIHDVHDLNVEVINQYFPIHTSFLKSIIFNMLIWEMKMIARWYEKKFFPKVDLVITTNQSYESYLHLHYKISKSLVIGNYPLMQPLPVHSNLRSILHLDDQAQIALYIGAITPGRNLEKTVHAAQYLNDNQYVVLIGNGYKKPRLKKIVDELKLENKVFFLDAVPYKDLIPITSGANLGMIIIDHINLSKYFAQANKLTEYMAAGIAVLASNSPENNRIIESLHCGFTSDFDNEKDLGVFLKEKLQLTAQLKEMGLRGRKAFEKTYNWDLEQQVFITETKKLING